MRRDAKASSAGSNQRLGQFALGRILRGAFATRAASIGADGSGAPSLRRLAIALCALAAATLLLALAATPSQGAGNRIFESTFGSAAQPTFQRPQGITVDYGTGDVYVIDATAKTLSRWHSDGTPSPFPALGTNVIDGKLGPGEKPCGEEPASCDAESASVPGGFTFPEFQSSRREIQVALDESGTATDGNIYLAVKEAAKPVNIFAADGHFLGQLKKFKEGEHAEGPEVPFGGEFFRGPCGVAVDQEGALYVGDFSENLVHKYVPQGLPHSPPIPTDNVANFSGLKQPCGIAAGSGSSDGYLFVLSVGFLYKLDSSTGQKVGTNPIVGGDNTATSTSSAPSVFPGSGNVFVGTGGSTGVILNNRIREFDASGAEPVEVSAIPQLDSTAEGFAIAASGNRLYLDRVGQANLQIFSAPLSPPVAVTNPATNLTGTTATLNGTVDRQGLATAACKFEYIDDAAYLANKKAKASLFTGATPQACAESNSEIDAGTAPVPVHADLTGLKAGELFHYRLSATTEAGTAGSEESTFATTVPPVIEDEHATAVTASEAEIRVLINPKFYPTKFRVVYGPGSSFGVSTPETSVGSDDIAHPLVFSLTDLAPGTTYEWRVVASSDNGLSAESASHSFTTYRPFAADSACANQPLRGGASTALPDCRAYEMVSPIDKNGGDALPGVAFNGVHDGYVQATADGVKITYSAEPAFAGQTSGRFFNQYIAARGVGGWDNSGINLPLGEQLPAVIRFEREVNAFSEDLCSMWTYDYNETPLNPDAQKGFNNLYRRQNCSPGIGSLETLTTAGPSAGAGQEYVSMDSVQGFSADGSASFFVAGAQLPTAPGTPAAAALNVGQVYLHLTGDAHLRLVSVLPNGQAAVPAAGTVNAIGGGPDGNLQNAVSTDGTRVFWGHSSGNSGQAKLYLRLNPAQPEPAASTIAVSEGGSATFWDATPSGSAALYSEGNLNAGTASLYRFDVATQVRAPLASKVYGLAGASEDLARIYLVSGEDHDAGGPAQENQPNLYLYENGGFTFVAKLLAGDLTTATAPQFGAVFPNPSARASRVTPDGRNIVFQSRAPLTGFDNTDAETGEADVEVFTYGVGDGLLCVSCNPAGIRPHGRELSPPYTYPFLGKKSGARAAAWIPTWEHPLHASRILSGDGNRIFFHSFDPLLPRDTNGTVQDLYQWEAPGTGSCETGDANYFSQNGGCVDLISSGESSYETEFLDAGSDGSDVFFTTSAGLLPQDPGSIDIYDARVGGGYPQPVAPAACEGEACQAPPSPPNDATPASSSFDGSGNVKKSAAKPKCKKGKVRKHGRCVKKQQKKKHKDHQRRADHDRRTAR